MTFNKNSNNLEDEVLAEFQNFRGESVVLTRHTDADNALYPLYTLQKPNGESHSEHNLFLLLKYPDYFDHVLASNIQEKAPELLEKELNPSDIKILSVEEPYDTDFGASVIQYKLGDVISFAFSDMEEKDVLANPEWAAKDVEINLAMDNQTGWIKWSDLSDNYIDAITRNPFEMCFIEHDDDKWTEEMSDTLWDEIDRLGGSNTIECGGEDCLVTVYAGAMGDINWNGHEYYGKPCFEHVVEKKTSLAEKIQSAAEKQESLKDVSDKQNAVFVFSPHDYEAAKAALLASGEEALPWQNDGYACHLERYEEDSIYYDLHLTTTGTTIMYGEAVEVLGMDETRVILHVPNDKAEQVRVSKDFFEQNFVPTPTRDLEKPAEKER